MESIFPHKLWKHSTCSIKKCFKSKASCGALHCKRSALFACEASLHILLSASPRPKKCAECTSYLTKLFISCFYCHTAATNCYSLCTKYHVNPICGLRAGWRWHNICAFAYGDPEWPRNSAFKISGFIFSLKSNWTSTNMQKNVFTLAAQSQVMYYNVKVLWVYHRRKLDKKSSGANLCRPKTGKPMMKAVCVSVQGVGQRVYYSHELPRPERWALTCHWLTWQQDNSHGANTNRPALLSTASWILIQQPACLPLLAFTVGWEIKPAQQPSAFSFSLRLISLSAEPQTLTRHLLPH